MGHAPFPVWRNVRIMKKEFSMYTSAGLVPLRKKWTCTGSGNCDVI